MTKILDQKNLQCFPMGQRSRHSIRFQFKSWLNILCWFICVLYLKWTPIWWLVVMVYSYYRNQTGILHYHYMDQIMVKFELDCRIRKNHSIKFRCVCAIDFFIFIFQNFVPERSNHSFVHSKCIQNIDIDWEGKEN